MPQTQTKYAIYKGRTYRVMWSGPTKFGPRVKLRFVNGTGEFWVNQAQITPTINSGGHGDYGSDPGDGTHCSCRGRGECQYCQEMI